MTRRPNRPTDDFLHRIGIFHIPANVDITFDDSFGYLDRVREVYVSPRAFHIAQVDDQGEAVLRTAVPAFESASRPKSEIYRDLRDTLVTQFNAIPIQAGLRTDLSAAPRPRPPSHEFLQKVGVARLPADVDVTFRGGESCQMAFIIRKVAYDGKALAEAEVPARTTAAFGPDKVWEKVRHTLVEFGAEPAPQKQHAHAP